VDICIEEKIKKKISLTVDERKKQMANLLRFPVLRSEAMKVLEPYVDYSIERHSQLDVKGWLTWTPIWAALCGRFPDSVCVTWKKEVMTVREMYKMSGVEPFPSDMLAFFSQHYVQDSLPVNVMTAALPVGETIVKEYLYFSMIGTGQPNYTSVRVQETLEPFDPFITIRENGREMMFQYKDGCRDMTTNCVASQLFAMYFSAMWKKPQFKQEEYYDNPSYGMWTIGPHINQIQRVLRKIPSTMLVVAPGDGIGVISRVRDNVIAGDMAVTSMTHPKVHKESITSTILRGLEQEREKVFVLSYVSAFMTESDWDSLKDQNVIVVDSFHVIIPTMQSQLRVVGPGVVSYGVEDLLSDTWEFRKKHVNVNYTENLLNARGFDLDTDSPATNYLLTIAPGKGYYPLNDRMKDYLVEHGIEPAEKSFGVRLVNTLQALGDGGYFSPIGKYVRDVPIVYVGVKSVFPYRTVLRTFMGEQTRSIFDQIGVTSWNMKGYTYFFFDKEERREFHWVISDPKTMASGTLIFDDVEVPRDGVVAEGGRIIVYAAGEKEKIFPLNSKGCIDTKWLDDIETASPELLLALNPYIPEAEKQCFHGYRQQLGGWTEFKKRYLYCERDKSYFIENSKYAQQLNDPYNGEQRKGGRPPRRKKKRN